MNFSLDSKYILQVTNFFDTKGCEKVIEILPKLLKHYPNLKLILVGDGPEKHKLQTLSHEKNLNDYIFFAGYILNSELIYYYNLADVFVLLTDRINDEGEPNVLLESLACNTPVITTNIFCTIHINIAKKK